MMISFPLAVVAEYKGACQDTKGDWKGSKPSLLPSQPDSATCLRICKGNLDVTGCTFNTLSGRCFLHFGEVEKGSGNNSIRCWKLESFS